VKTRPKTALALRRSVQPLNRPSSAIGVAEPLLSPPLSASARIDAASFGAPVGIRARSGLLSDLRAAARQEAQRPGGIESVAAGAPDGLAASLTSPQPQGRQASRAAGGSLGPLATSRDAQRRQWADWFSRHSSGRKHAGGAVVRILSCQHR